MIIIELNRDGNIETALKKLKNKFIKNKTQKILLEKKEFKSNSEKRRKEINQKKYILKKGLE